MKAKHILQLGVAALVLVAGIAQAESTIAPEHPYAYGANIGWVNARGDVTNGAVIGPSYCTGFLWSANCGWIGLGKGPINGWHYSNTSANDWGVNHDGQGNLTGYAYGANIGWVVLEQTYGRPRLNLLTGNLDGYLYGANIGWISLSNAQAFVRTTRLEAGPDSDGDAIPDAWEMAKAGTLTALDGGGHDADGDGATDVQEYGADTHPLDDDDLLRLAPIGATGDTDRLAWNSRPTRLYRLKTTNRLGAATGAWADAAPGLLDPANGSMMTQTVSGVMATTRYYRVQAVMPLSR